MKNKPHKRMEEPSVQSANFVAVLAIVTEMARRLNENISKVQFEPLDASLLSAGAPERSETCKT